MIYHIVAGGPNELLPDLSFYGEEEIRWIGVDRGVYYLLKAGIMPFKAFGDFDSITAEERIWIESRFQGLEIFPAEKDETDMDIALNWVSLQKGTRVRIFGGTGGRLDHFFGNVQLLLRGLEMNIKAELIDRQNIVRALRPGTYDIKLLKEYPYISFLPVSEEVEGITLTGFKYPLNNCHIRWGSTLCISNELINQSGTFSFSRGILLMVRSRD